MVTCCPGIGTRLSALFGFAFAISIGVGVFGIVQIRQIDQTATEVWAEWLPRIEAIGDLKNAVGRHEILIARQLQTINYIQLHEVSQRAEGTAQEIDAVLRRYRSTFDRAGERGLVERFATQWAQCRDSHKKSLELLESADPALALAEFETVTRPAFGQAVATLNELVAFAKRESEQAVLHGRAIHDRALTLTLVVILLGGACVITAALWVQRNIGTPILDLALAVKRLAAGDYGPVIAGADRRDELGTLARAIVGYRDSLARLNVVLASAPVGVLITGPDRRIGLANDTALQIFRRDAAGLIGASTRLFYESDEAFAAAGQRFYPILDAGCTVDEQIRLMRGNGEPFWAHFVGRRISMDDPALGTVWVVDDISERKEAERALRESEERLRLGAQVAGFGTFDWRVSGDRHIWSPDMCRIYGIQPGTPITLALCLEIIAPEDRAPMRVEMERILAPGSTGKAAIQYRIIRPDGEVRWIHAHWQALSDSPDGTGPADRIVGAAQDITDQRQALQELEAAKARAEAANAAKGDFLAAMSHELRTPLNAIIGFSEMLWSSEPVPERKRNLNTIRTAGGHLLRLVQDILDLARIDAGRVRLDPVPFDFRDFLKEIEALFAEEARSRDLAFSITAAAALPRRLEGDPGLLRQILMNLIGNALKFTPRGSVSITVDTEGPIAGEVGRLSVVFHVADTGIGIRPENQERIFGMFEQEETNLSRRFGGTGLGLTISRRLVALMGGRLWLESTPGVGSRFSFAVPLGVGDQGDDWVAGQDNSGTVEMPPSAEAWLLVVEDEPFSQELIRLLLEKNGYQVSAVGSGLEAVEQLQRRPFALVLMDIQLPIMNGIEVTRKVRAGQIPGCNPAIPIIALTAYAMPGDRERFLAEGITDYLSKPIDIHATVALVNRLVGSPQRRQRSA